MKLTEQQIWQCNNTEDGGVHICLDHQNVADFARSIEREMKWRQIPDDLPKAIPFITEEELQQLLKEET